MNVGDPCNGSAKDLVVGKGLLYVSNLQRRQEQFIKDSYNMTSLEMEIIHLIMEDGKKKMKDIGGAFNVKLSTLTSIIDKMEKQRIVKRENSKKDRRVVYLDVSNKGKELYHSYKRFAEAVEFILKEKMEKGDFEILMKGIEKMTEAVDAVEVS
ncbi:MAG: MarR family transcriptional regulator [Bacteroidota bacterium]